MTKYFINSSDAVSIFTEAKWELPFSTEKNVQLNFGLDYPNIITYQPFDKVETIQGYDTILPTTINFFTSVGNIEAGINQWDGYFDGNTIGEYTLTAHYTLPGLWFWTPEVTIQVNVIEGTKIIDHVETDIVDYEDKLVINHEFIEPS